MLNSREPSRSHHLSIAVWLVCGALGCSSEPPPLPNVVLVTFDTTRWDHFGVTGDPEAHTPSVDALAASGLLFENAYTEVPLTLPAHTSIMTGLEPVAHDVHNNGRFAVSEGIDTLAEILAAAGYDTAAFVSAVVLGPMFKLDQGFDVYTSPEKGTKDPLDFSVPRRSGEEVTRDAAEWLRARSAGAMERDAPDSQRSAADSHSETPDSNPNAPFFIWAHYYDPHLPRDVNPPFDAIPDPYRAEIAYADNEFGKLLEAARSHSGGRETLVVFTADHGEAFGEHGEATHGLLAYDATLHVPLMIAGPGVPAARRSKAFARHVDIVPTVLGVLGIAPGAEITGRNLLEVEHEQTDPYEVFGLFESRGPESDFGWAPIEGIRSSRWKFTALPNPVELYDVRADPRELSNLAERNPEVRDALQQRFEALRAERERAGRSARRQKLALDEMEQLAALGYIAAPMEFAVDDVPDPRKVAHVSAWVDGARAQAKAGRFDEAIGALETLQAVPAVRGLVLRTLGSVYASAGRFDDAAEAYGRYLELTGAAEAYVGLARVLIHSGRLEEALESMGPPDRGQVTVELMRARALSRLGRAEEAHAAVDWALPGPSARARRLHEHSILVLDAAPQPDGEARLRALVKVAPQDPILANRLGFYLASFGEAAQAEDAIELLRVSADARPEDLEIRSNYGWGLYELGRYQEAVTVLGKATELKDSSPKTQMKLAFALGRAGERQRALELAKSVLGVRPAEPWSDEGRAFVAEMEAALNSELSANTGEESS